MQDPDGKPCQQHFTIAKGVDTKLRDAKRIRKHVTRGPRKIRRAAPNAQVFVVGHPRLLPEQGTLPGAALSRRVLRVYGWVLSASGGW